MRKLTWVIAIVVFWAGTLPISAQERPDKPKAQKHRFLDKTNKVLFSGLVVTRTLDYHSTYAALRNGAVEHPWPRGAGPIVQSKTGFAAYQAANIGITIGVAYWLHRKNHHRWERIASIVQISWIGAAMVNNYRNARRDFR